MFGRLDYMHIVALWVVFVLLIAAYIILRIWTKQTILGNDKDFITVFIEKKSDKILKNDVKMSITAYFVLLIVCPIVIGAGVFFFTQNAVFSILCALSGIMIPDGLLLFLKQRENKVFEEKYERSLEQLSSSLKAGMSIMQAVKEVSENRFIYEPIRRRYEKMYADMTMGVSVTDAFRSFAESVDSEDAKDVALVVEIQDEVGGREAEAIMSIADDIHDRLMLRKEIRSMFAGTSYMVWLMDFLPLLIIIFLCFTNNSYRSYYLNGYGILVLIGIVLACLIGSFINHRKISKIIAEA